MMHFTSVLLPAPFSPSRAWNEPGRTFQLDLIEGGEIAEAHGHCDGIHAERAARQGRLADDHDKAPISAVEVETAPNTPPCILIILRA